MNIGDPLNDLSFAIYDAIEKSLPNVAYTYKKPGSKGQGEDGGYIIEKRTRRPKKDELSIVMFEQTWGDTSLGFGGIGCQSMTTAYTVVVTGPSSSAVYFGGRLAYVIDRPNLNFFEDLRTHNMREVRGAEKRYKRSLPTPDKETEE